MPVSTVLDTLNADEINNSFTSLGTDLARVARSNDNWEDGKGVITQLRWLGGKFVRESSDTTGTADLRMHTFTFSVPGACRLVGMHIQGWGTGATGAAIKVSLSGVTINVLEGQITGVVSVTATRGSSSAWDQWNTYTRFGQDDLTNDFGSSPTKRSDAADWLLLPGLEYTITAELASADDVDVNAYPLVTISLAQELARR